MPRSVGTYLVKRPIFPAPHRSYPYPEPTKGIPVPPPVELPLPQNLPNPENVQGDVYLTLPKQFERFLFFTISDVAQFRACLSQYVPLITSSAETARRILIIASGENKEELDFVSSNIAFSRAGLDLLGIKGKLLDDPFDTSTPYTKPHALILVTAKTEQKCNDHLQQILTIFGQSITVLEIPEGHVREYKREFFGWRDGISQPALDGLVRPSPGQLVVKPGVIVLGYAGDPVYDGSGAARPPFTKDGSFLVYTKLQQDVWAFQNYIKQNWQSVPANPAPGYCLSDDQRKSLFCARLFGRFASGVPLALSPYIDDPAFLDDNLIDNFNYTERAAGSGCPLFSHVLKTNPRSVNLQDVPESVIKESVIVRAGIPYGPELSTEELEALKTLEEDKKGIVCLDRGLLFVSYQTSISNGFLRQLNHWSRNDGFPPGFGPVGQDPIIGQPQLVWFKDPVEEPGPAPPTEYVRQLDGGLYFVPSISTVSAWATSN